MSWEATAWAKKQTTGSPARKAVLLVIADYANHDGEAWPGREVIAEDSEQSVDSVDRALRALEEADLLFIEKGLRNGPYQAPNRYRLNMDLEAVKKHMRGNRLRSKPGPQIAALDPEPQPEPQTAAPEPQPEPQPGPQPGPQLCGPNQRTLEPKNSTPPLPAPGGGQSKIFNRTFLEPDLEAALRAIAAQPFGTPTIEAIEKALRPLGYEVFRFPRLPENDRGRADKISASAVLHTTGFSIGFEIDPPRPRHLDKLARYPGRAKVVIMRESDLQEPPEVVDALLVRKAVEPKPALPALPAATTGPQIEAGPKDPGAVWPRLPDRATNSGPLPGAAKGKVFVFEDTPEWRAWMAWWDTPAARERYPRILKPAANTQWPDAPHRGRRGWFFETAWPPSTVGEGPGPLIEGTAVRPLLT